jgi:hypothetical protein
MLQMNVACTGQDLLQPAELNFACFVQGDTTSTSALKPNTSDQRAREVSTRSVCCVSE